jgi:hypothetical protein
VPYREVSVAASPFIDTDVHRPGMISAFLVYNAGLSAVGCWVWLAILAAQGSPVSGWLIVAAAGAISSTVAAITLGARHTLEAAAASRQEALLRAVVELSWFTFDQPAAAPTGTDAAIIPLTPESRPRQRR